MPVKKKFIFLLFFFGCNTLLFAQVLRIEINSKPQQHKADSLFIAGSFNNWNPSLQLYSLKKDEEGREFIELKNIPKGITEFKMTRGGWNKTESSSNGATIHNRILNFQKDTVLKIDIAGWADDFPSRPPVTTKSKNVFIVDTAFYIPQLNRSRRIWIYLPEGYATSRRNYPVLYMHDGQNLFDNLIAPFGEWGADEMMDSIKDSRQSIIVAIDHGGNTRLTEYNPYTTRFGKGEGDAYVDFIVQKLKPYIDSVYRTKSSRENTLIAGSSMGGLISFYAVVKYPNIFGGAGVFSPAFWLAPDLIKELQSKTSTYKPAFYFVCGELESEKMVSDMKAVYDAVKKSGNNNLYFKTLPSGRHNESFWQTEMYDCYYWLLKHQIK
jgi:predicted alpha/beta superfamily hydrolase